MIMRRIVAALFSIIVLAPGASTVFAADKEYPNKFIRIVNAAAGGTGDFTTRTLAKGLIDDVGWSIFVDNRPGALSAIETVAKAAPDG
jgi:tripartite-type tricarboxylate transporter receptor subunit TctC